MKALVIGGNRYFGKTLVKELLNKNYQVSLLNRGHLEAIPGTEVLRCDRTNKQEMQNVLKHKNFDFVFDQVCYEAVEVLAATEIFKDSCGQYIFTSTQSVYSPEHNLAETEVDPYHYQFERMVPTKESYAEGKRQAEAVFMQKSSFPVKAIRFPFVLGVEDYTLRLKTHVDHVFHSKPLYFPNIEALISLAHADDAGKFLSTLTVSDGKSDVINCCSPDPISLRAMMDLIELKCGRKAVFVNEEKLGTHSPYGVSADGWMSADKIKSLGFQPRPVTEYLPALIDFYYRSLL